MNETIRAHGLAILRSSLLVVGMGVVLGGLAAPIWHSMVTLPTYTVGSDGAASTSKSARDTARRRSPVVSRVRSTILSTPSV